MVRFLLENSLGAWWASRHPDSELIKEWKYLRFRDDGAPAAGTFPDWPEHAKDVTVMDPCCGSGHFLVAAADMLRKMRMAEEELALAAAATGVLRSNLYGLEIDPRCTQLAAFALAFDTWKSAGYGEIPLPNVACSGIAVGGSKKEWADLAAGDGTLEYTLERLYELFKDAPDLGSLINPLQVQLRDRMFTAEYEEVAELLQRALAKHGEDPAAAVFGAAAEGAARAGELLASKYTLVATNPPYLGRGKQDGVLKTYADAVHAEAKADLATIFIERCRSFVADGGVYSMVTPQNWLFLSSYKRLRQRLLREQTWGLVARLGAGAFDTISGEVVNAALIVLSQSHPSRDQEFNGIDASTGRMSFQKADLLRTGDLMSVEQAGQLANPDARIVLSGLATGRKRLAEYASTYEGLHSGDYPRFGRHFWELLAMTDGWVLQQETSDSSMPWDGRANSLLWEDGSLIQFVQQRLGTDNPSQWIKGREA